MIGKTFWWISISKGSRRGIFHAMVTPEDYMSRTRSRSRRRVSSRLRSRSCGEHRCRTWKRAARRLDLAENTQFQELKQKILGLQDRVENEVACLSKKWDILEEGLKLLGTTVESVHIDINKDFANTTKMCGQFAELADKLIARVKYLELDEEEKTRFPNIGLRFRSAIGAAPMKHHDILRSRSSGSRRSRKTLYEKW